MNFQFECVLLYFIYLNERFFRINIQLLLPSDASWGVASIACQPPYPLGKSGRAIQTSFQTWKFQIESFNVIISLSGVPNPLVLIFSHVYSSPPSSKNRSMVKLWFVSWADTKFVTDRQGIPRARHTTKKLSVMYQTLRWGHYAKSVRITCYHYRWKDPTLTILYGLPSFVFHVFLDDFNTACPLPWCSSIVIWLLPSTWQNSFIIGIIDLFEKWEYDLYYN